MWRITIFTLLLVFSTAATVSVKASRREKRQVIDPNDCPKDCKIKPMDISFVVDASASIWPQNFTIGLNFIEDFVDLFDISPTGVRVSLVTYGEVAYGEDAFGFNQYTNKDSLKEAISKIPYRSGQRTNTSGGIRYMLQNHYPEARGNVRRITIVMTDGNSQEQDLTAAAAKEAHQTGMEVFAIGIGQAVSPGELHNIASDNKHVFIVSSYNMLDTIKKRLAYEACDVVPFPPCQMDPVDLSFVIDSSQSIGEANFTVGMTFVREVVDAFDVNPTHVRVSAVTYGDVVYEQDAFDFDTYSDKKDILDALSAITWRVGPATNTGAAIEYMRTRQMPKARPFSAHISIVITDGKSQKWMETREQAKLARDNGIVMYAIGVGRLGPDLDEEELTGIAGDRSRVLTADSYAELNLIKNNLINLACEGILTVLQAKGEAYRQ